MLVYQRVSPIDSPSGGFPVEKMGKSSSTTQQIHGVLSTGHEHGQISLGAHREVTVFIHLNSQIFESLLPCLDEFGEDFGGSLVVGVSFHHHQLLLALLEMTHENIHIISQRMMIVPVDLPFLDISGGFTGKQNIKPSRKSVLVWPGLINETLPELLMETCTWRSGGRQHRHAAWDLHRGLLRELAKTFDAFDFSLQWCGCPVDFDDMWGGEIWGQNMPKHRSVASIFPK